MKKKKSVRYVETAAREVGKIANPVKLFRLIFISAKPLFNELCIIQSMRVMKREK